MEIVAQALLTMQALATFGALALFVGGFTGLLAIFTPKGESEDPVPTKREESR